MTPEARVAAAIEILDDILNGTAAEKALTSWARRSRFAGSTDRNAVRDHVFDALRKRHTYQIIASGSLSDPCGRSLMIGALRHGQVDVDQLFTGQGYGPAALSQDERAAGGHVQPVANLPEWVFDALVADMGEAQALSQAQALTERAPITLRSNRTKQTRAELIDQLEAEGFSCTANPLASDAITIGGAHRGLVQTQAFEAGQFEMQDAASQAVVESLPEIPRPRLLDFCAGGGGKTLALAAKYGVSVMAHDAASARMAGVAARARRAGADVVVVSDKSKLDAASFDIVVVDAPCSGSGSWRRAPDAKWLLTPDRLSELVSTQREILKASQQFVSTSGALAYVTCSILRAENTDQVAWFLDANPEWRLEHDHSWPVSDHGDGFFLALFRRR